MKNRLLIFICFLLFCFFTLGYFYFTEISVVPKGEVEYSDEINQWLKEKRLAASDRDTEAENRQWDKLKEISDAGVKDIAFYGRVIDQDGNPVPSAMVVFDASSGYLSEGTGRSSVRTDNDGLFSTRGSRGRALLIRDVVKPGYVYVPPFEGGVSFESFRRFDDSMIWSDYDSDQPYVLNVWRVDERANVYRGELLGMIFEPNGTPYTLNLQGGGKSVFSKGLHDGDVNISFLRKDGFWQVIFSSEGGGFVESEDQYMNLAPSSGYVKEVIYSGGLDRYEVRKKLYFQSGSLYGKLDVRIVPTYREQAGMHINYTLNVDGKRDLFGGPN